MINLMSFKRRV